LQNLGQLTNAEISQRKAIQLKPTCAEAHSNLGSVLRDLKKLKEAEVVTRLAIKLNPEFANAHSNLGGILLDLGKATEAEKSTREAIRIKPNLATPYSNLGSILISLGKLKEAEVSTRKAIELKSNFLEAYLNLEGILKDLGKLKELIHLSNDTLKLNSTNTGDKLQSTINITIANLLQGDFPSTLINLNKSNELIKQGALKTIKNKNNQKNIFAYFELISSLYPELNKKKKQESEIKIDHIGESHCISFAHQSISISSEVKEIQPILIEGAKAWHFANKENNRWKNSLFEQLKNKDNNNDEVFISFGEIDCRKDEGILPYSIKNDKEILEICDTTIKCYLNYMEKILSTYYSKRFYFGIPAPSIKNGKIDDLDRKRIELIKIYNSILKKEIKERGMFFIDVYELTSNKIGINNMLYMCDNIHLSSKSLPILLEDFLYKPI
jgi:tetratricopeptide (TPR) repeat protein